MDTDARAPTSGTSDRTCIQGELIVEGSGFILARRATHGSEGDWKPVIDMLGQPIKPESLAADTGYSAGPLRKHRITAYIPIHPNQKNSVVAQRGFTYHATTLCVLTSEVISAHQKDCAAP